MKNINLKITATFALACALVPPPALALPGAAGEAYGTLSTGIIRYARANAIQKIAVLDFTAKGQTGKNDADYVSEKI